LGCSWYAPLRDLAYQERNSSRRVAHDYTDLTGRGALLAVDNNDKIRTFFALSKSTLAQYGAMTVEQYIASKLGDEQQVSLNTLLSQ
jgi:hypothetical protein